MAEHCCEAWRPPPLIYDERGFGLVALLRRFLDVQAGSIWRDIAEVLPEVQGRVLDVGCGAQPYRRLVNPSADYAAIDSEEARHFGYKTANANYYVGDAWPIGNAVVDFILSTETIEHVPDPCMFLREARRCLTPGGTLLLTVPFSARWHFIPYDYWRFTPAGLAKLLREADFKDIKVYARGNEVTVACYKEMALILRLLIPQTGSIAVKLALRFLGILLVPALLALAVIANLSLRGNGGDDCLGYTVIAS